jgi:chemotaxis protein methyltransferase CheR
MSGSTLPSDTFPFVRRLVQERTAIRLDENAGHRIEARLEPIAQNWQFDSVPALLEKLKKGGSEPALADAVVDAMTTGETAFFRDYGVFEYLRVLILPQLIEARRDERRLVIWCAACATGQEPYSLAMLLHDEFPEVLDWQLTILASDVSPRQLQRADEASYSQVEINRGLPARYLARHFQERGGQFVLNDHIKSMVQFERINLAQDWPVSMSWDLVLLRHVLIYFDSATRKKIQEKLAQTMSPDGILIVGRGEMPLMHHDLLRPLDPETPAYTIRASDGTE